MEEIGLLNCIILLNILSFAPWCGHCKRLAPIFKDAAESVKGEIYFGEVDATKERSIITHKFK